MNDAVGEGGIFFRRVPHGFTRRITLSTAELHPVLPGCRSSADLVRRQREPTVVSGDPRRHVQTLLLLELDHGRGKRLAIERHGPGNGDQDRPPGSTTRGEQGRHDEPHKER